MKRIFVLFTLATLLFTSCEDFLVEEPRLSQSTEITMSTYNGLNKATAGAYSILADGEWYGAFYVLDAEMRAGNAALPTNTDFQSGRMTTPSYMSYNASSTSALWGYGYYLISAVNNVMDNLEGKATGDVTDQDVDNLKAECLFLRALAHFDMVRLYGVSYKQDSVGLGVPVVLHTDASGTETPARNTVQEVYNQVIADLREAEAIIDPTYQRSATDSYSMVSLNAIRALLCRAYLYTEQWQNAADYATLVIESGDYNLWSAAELPTVWVKDLPTDGGEVIFEIYGSKSNSYDEYWEGPSYMTNPTGHADCAAHDDLVNLYEAGDVRGTLFRTDPENVSGSWWTTKYAGKGVATPDLNNVIVLRLSEMYLNRAEALVNGATISGTTARADLNAIRANRGVAALSSAGSEVVFAERRLELAFEGHLWFDYARTGRASVRSDYPLAADSYMWSLPIPKRELDVNANLVQNEGY